MSYQELKNPRNDENLFMQQKNLNYIELYHHINSENRDQHKINLTHVYDNVKHISYLQ